MKKVVILGGKGTAVVIAEQIEDARLRFGMEIEVMGFAFDDPAFKDGINGWPVLCGTREAFEKYQKDEDVFFVFSMYRSDKIKERAKLCESYGIPEERWLTFVHPDATVCKSVKIGYGTIILTKCVVNPNVRIGSHNILHSGVFIAHDTEIGTHNFIAAQTCIGSEIRIGDYNFLGLNSTCRTFVKIGDNNLIGMGSVVLKDVEDNEIVAGNPAKFLRING